MVPGGYRSRRLGTRSLSVSCFLDVCRSERIFVWNCLDKLVESAFALGPNQKKNIVVLRTVDEESDQIYEVEINVPIKINKVDGERKQWFANIGTHDFRKSKTFKNILQPVCVTIWVLQRTV